MKKLMLLLLATLFITASCSGRKVLKTKNVETVSVTDKTVTETKTVKSLRDSVRLKVFTNETNETLTTVWEFEAPSVADTLKRTPFWLKVGRDSVDVTKLPVGSKLRTKDIKKKNAVTSNVDEKRGSVTDSTSSTVKRNDVRTDAKNEDVRKEVEKESLRWFLFVGGFAFGWLLWYAVKFIFIKIKNYYGIK